MYLFLFLAYSYSAPNAELFSATIQRMPAFLAANYYPCASAQDVIG